MTDIEMQEELELPAAACCRIPDVEMLSHAEADRLARGLKALGHPIRLQIVHILSQTRGRLCVCEIEAAFDVKQPTISHHLKTLREANLVDAEQRGLYLYYRVLPHAMTLLGDQVRRLSP